MALATAEVERVADNNASSSIEDMAQLDYVKACANEAMRLKPVAPLLALQTRQGVMIGNVRVPKGIVVSCVMRANSVNDAHLPNAAAFEPERWLADGDTSTAKAKSAKRISMPFGAGPCICPGRYLALLEMRLAIATILRDFDITSVDTPQGGPAQEVLKFAMAPVGLSMRLLAKAKE